MVNTRPHASGDTFKRRGVKLLKRDIFSSSKWPPSEAEHARPRVTGRNIERRSFETEKSAGLKPYNTS